MKYEKLELNKLYTYDDDYLILKCTMLGIKYDKLGVNFKVILNGYDNSKNTIASVGEILFFTKETFNAAISHNIKPF